MENTTKITQWYLWTMYWHTLDVLLSLAHKGIRFRRASSIANVGVHLEERVCGISREACILTNRFKDHILYAHQHHSARMQFLIAMARQMACSMAVPNVAVNYIGLNTPTCSASKNESKNVSWKYISRRLKCQLRILTKCRSSRVLLSQNSVLHWNRQNILR